MKSPYKSSLQLFPMLCIGLTSCVTPQGEYPALTLMQSEQFMARSLHDAGLQQFMQEAHVLPDGQPLPKVENFRSLYWAAIYFNPSMAEARAQIEAVKAAAITAGQTPNPVITFGPGRDTSVSPKEWLFDVGLSIPIETNGKLELRQAVAKEQITAAEVQLVGKAWDIRAAVLGSLIDYDIARETVTRTQALTQTQSAIVTQYNQRLAQGQMPTPVASQAQISYQQTLVQLEQAKTDLKQAEARLSGAIGVPVSALEQIQIDDTLPSMTNMLSDAIMRKHALQAHPTLLGALADYRAAHQALCLELAKQIPDVDIGPGYEWNSQQGGKFSLGLSLTLPIANQNEGPIAEAQAKRLVAGRHFEVLQASVINAIEQAEAAQHSAQRELATAQKILELQDSKQKRLSSMIQQNEAGELPLLYAKSEMQTAEVNELAAQAKLIKASAALEDALRQPLFGPVIEPSLLAHHMSGEP